jgi:hypothetical protein
MFMTDWRALLTPQKAYWRLSPQFQFSLSAVTLGIYLGEYNWITFSSVCFEMSVVPCTERWPEPRESVRCESLWEYTTTYSQIKANLLPVSVGGFTHREKKDQRTGADRMVNLNLSLEVEAAYEEPCWLRVQLHDFDLQYCNICEAFKICHSLVFFTSLWVSLHKENGERCVVPNLT